MNIRKYAVTLARLKRGDLELLRVKRNSADINRWMHFRHVITPAMQTAWFESINNMYNSYFLIEYENEKVGLIHAKNQDFLSRTCEGGVFIWDQKHRGTGLSGLCSVMMTDFAFYIMKLRTVYAKVLRGNRAAQNHNRSLGYVPATRLPSDSEIEWLVLEKGVYEERMRGIRHAIGIVTQDPTRLSVSDIDFTGDTAEEIEQLYLRLPEDILEDLKPAIQTARNLRGLQTS